MCVCERESYRYSVRKILYVCFCAFETYNYIYLVSAFEGKILAVRKREGVGSV